MAAAVKPNMPAPCTRTDLPRNPPATRKQAATVAVAQFAGHATSSAKSEGTSKTCVPGRKTINSESPPEGTPVWTACPYLKSRSHFCSNPLPQNSHRPQEAMIDQVTRRPVATSIPSASCPSMEGVGATLRPANV